MNLNVDYLIDFFDKLSSKESKEEMGEQDAAAAPSSGGGGSSVPKWADSYKITRGPGNMLGKAGEKWETGLTRGPANTIW
jgi:hypothetical protein